MRNENANTKQILLTLQVHTISNSFSPPKARESVLTRKMFETEEVEQMIKSEIVDDLSKMARSLKLSRAMHNNFSESGRLAAEREGSSNKNSNDNGNNNVNNIGNDNSIARKKIRPKSAPLAQRKKERENQLFLQQPQPQPESATMPMTMTPGQIRPGKRKPRPQSASADLLSRAQTPGINIRAKALLIRDMQRTADGNSLASCLLTKDVKKELMKIIREKREKKTKACQQRKAQKDEKVSERSKALPLDLPSRPPLPPLTPPCLFWTLPTLPLEI